VRYKEEGDVAVETAPPQLKRPPMYQVVLLNDDYTPMDFVVHVLKYFFAMPQEKAERIMFQVHNNGKGICGVYTYDVAETKVAQVNEYARSQEHPLLCVMEAV
jgi:ATP-dependent Clp protease adaptor protein ClpS